jgi:hypothetical protein
VAEKACIQQAIPQQDSANKTKVRRTAEESANKTKVRRTAEESSFVADYFLLLVGMKCS